MGRIQLESRNVNLGTQESHYSHHRIIEWFALEGTFKGHPVQPPCNEQGHLQLDQQRPFQLTLKESPGAWLLGGLLLSFSAATPLLMNPHTPVATAGD